MPEDELGAATRSLIRAAIHSFEALELLLLLRRTAPRTWTVEQLASALATPSDTVAHALEALMAHGLVARVGEQLPIFEYHPRDAALAAAADQLAAHCEASRMSVVMAISSNAIDRVRNGALRAFSDVLRRSGAKKDS